MEHSNNNNKQSNIFIIKEDVKMQDNEKKQLIFSAKRNALHPRKRGFQGFLKRLSSKRKSICNWFLNDESWTWNYDVWI